MKIQYKSSLLFFIVSMVAIFLTTVIHHNLNSDLLLKQQENELEFYNDDKIYHLTETLDSLTDIVMTMSKTPSIVESTKVSNSMFSSLNEKERTEYINKLEDIWQSPERDVNNLLTAPVSEYLKSIQDLYHCDIGEIFLTDKYGVAIASTGVLTTRTHARKNWWKASFHDGIDGKVFIDDRGFDESVQGYVIGIVVPVTSNHEVVGILKVNFNIESVINRIADISSDSEKRTIVVRTGGLIVKEFGKDPLSTSLDNDLLSLIENDESSPVSSEDGKELFSYSKISLEDRYSMGGTGQSEDHNKGNQNEDWYVITVSPLSAYSDFSEYLQMIELMALFLLVFFFAFSLYLGHLISKPIIHSLHVIERIGKGDFSAQTGEERCDEIGRLKDGINQMARQLESTMTSKSALEDEIDKRIKEEQKFRNLYDSMNEAFAHHEIILDGNGKPIDYRFLSINPAFERMLGTTEKDMVGKTVLEVFPETEPYWIEVFGEVALSRKPIEIENYFETLDKYYHVSAYSPAKGQFAVSFTDITRLKNLEQSLKTERDLLSVTLSSIGDGVITTDGVGNITFLNPISESLTGWTNEEAQGNSLLKVFNIKHEETGVSCEDPAKKVIRTNKIVELANHTSLHSKDGHTYIIEDSAAPIRNSQGEIIGVVIVFRNETEKKKLSAKLNNQQKIESLGVLAGGIAHDFNNYLSGIFGYIELAKGELAENTEVAQSYLDEALEIFHNTKSLTQQLLTFSKGSESKKEYKDISQILLKSINFSLSGSNIKPQISIDDDLKPCFCDDFRISQCFDNLIINAKQSMPSGGSLNVFAKNIIAESNEYIQITISDTGCGINKESLNRIFDPFYTTKDEGHGLGLATVYSIIKQHDGWIDVESEIDKGTTFSIYLPAEEGSIPSESVETIVEQGTGSILLMDDQEYILDITHKFLKGIGFDVLLARSGKEAIEIVQENSHSQKEIVACILDLTLPGELGGIEVAKEIKELFPDLITIAFSGYSESQVMGNPSEYGFDGSMDKSFTKMDLLQVLKEHNLIKNIG